MTNSIAIGLDAIFKTESEVESSADHNKINFVRVGEIDVSPYQPRKHFSSDELNELSKSIKQHGILQPLIIRKKNGRHELIAGERRLRAAKLAELEEVPTILCNVDDDSAMAFSLIENIQRSNLNAIEESEAYYRLLTECKLSHEELSERMGKSRSHITNILRLRNLSHDVKAMIVNEKITMGHGRALLGLSEVEQKIFANKIVDKKLSVREVESLIKGSTHCRTVEKQYREIHPCSKVWENEIRDLLGLKTRLAVDKFGKGSLVIQLESEDQIKSFIEQCKYVLSPAKGKNQT